MSDDRSDRTPSLTRRQALAAIAAAGGAGLAGCSGLQSGPGDAGNETNTTRRTGQPTTTNGTETTPTTETTTAAPGETLYSGETIPPTNYGEMATRPPTVAAPSAEVTNPVLTAEDVTDFGRVDYVADPFLFREEGSWYLFFEIFNADRSPDSAIGLATSEDGLHWEYQGVALEKNSHTSFPLVWKWNGEYYMSPADGKAVELFRAKEFPSKWDRLGTVLEESFFPHDPVYAHWNDRWWLFTSRENQDVMVYHSPELTAGTDNWTPHANNPVVTDRIRAARQGGRPIVMDDALYLFFQDLEYEYGDQIRAFRVTELSENTYSDEEVQHSPVLTGFGSGWNSRKMHHYDAWSLGEEEGWRAAVDGAHGPSGNEVEWGIGIYDAPNVRAPDPSAIPYDARKTSGYYRLDGKSTVAVDDSKGGNHGMIRGTTTTDVGGCPGRTFGKDRDRIVFPTTFETLGSDAFTVFVRGKLRAPEQPQTLFAYTSRHIPQRLAARYDPDGPGWKFDLNGTGDQVQPEVGAPISTKEPFQLALTYQRGEGYRVVQDGEELTTARDVGGAFHEVAVPVVGGTVVGQFPWQGDVSHVGVFDEALDQSTLKEFTSTVCSSK
jgi:hypothetical protein